VINVKNEKGDFFQAKFQKEERREKIESQSKSLSSIERITSKNIKGKIIDIKVVGYECWKKTEGSGETMGERGR
jgi:hypothetical protein